MGEETRSSDNEAITSKSKHTKKVKNRNKITKKTESNSRLCGDTGHRCNLSYGDHVSDQIFHTDDGSILEKLIKTRQSSVRTGDVYVLSANVTNTKKRYGSDETEETQRLTRARSVLADATEWSHLGRSTLVLKGGREHKEDKVYHEDTSDYIVASTVAKSGEMTPEQEELLKKAQSRELASYTINDNVIKKKVRHVHKEHSPIPEVPNEMSKETSAPGGGDKTNENENVCIKLIGNIKKFCSCLPENLAKPSDTDQQVCKRKPKKAEADESVKRDNVEEKQTEVYALIDLQTPTFGQLGREAGRITEENANSLPANTGTNNTSNVEKSNKSKLKNKNNRRASLKCSKLRYNPNNEGTGKLKCSVRLTGKDKGDLLVTGEDGKTHTLSFKVKKGLNIVPES